jgi:hypothetical protein
VTPSAVVLLVALAGALGCSRVRRSQLSGLAAAALGAMTTIVASPALLDRLGDDPFLVDGPAIEWLAVSGAVLEEFAVPSTTSRIQLSPDGRRIAALHQSEAEDAAGTSAFYVGRAGEDLVPIAADDLTFADNDHVLSTESDVSGTTIRKIRADAARDVVWTKRIEGMVAPALTFDPRSQTWRLTGWDRAQGLFRAEGIVGGSLVEEMRWPPDPDSDASINAFTTVGDDALVVETRYGRGMFDRLLTPRWTWLVLLAQPYSQETRYWAAGARGRTDLGASRLGADCHAGVLANGALLCSVYDGTRTRLVSMDATGRIGPLGWLDGRFISDRSIVPGWITGWADSTPVAIRLSTGQALRLAGHAAGIGQLAAAGDRLGAVTLGRNGLTVRTYAVDRVSGPEAKR